MLENVIFYYAPVALSTPSNQNIALTNNRETPINTNPIAACCNILNPFLYFVSSPAAVTIWKPQKSKTTNAINANIPNIQLMKLLITSIRFPHWSVLAFIHVIPALFVAFTPNHGVVVTANVAKLHILSITKAKVDTTFNENFFIFFIF